jgi:putative membrane-bound dehydrogenase-like protein
VKVLYSAGTNLLTQRANRFPLFVHLPVFVWLVRACAAYGAEPAFHVPPGFLIECVAAPPAVNFPMFATVNEKGRLYVTESSGGDLYDELRNQVRTCRISMLEDRDHDGRYEIARVFADHLAPSMGLAWHEGKLYVADPPDLVTLQDVDNDGRADKRTVVLTGFGHSDNGSLHGLIFGPDDWLYFTTGNPDGYDLRGPDGSHARGQCGALIRCQPDGSKVETVARGFENLVEIVFIPDGSIIGTLNWYQLPERGARDALIHILEGSQFPIHPVDNVPHLQFNAVLPPLALFPAVAHSGLEIYRGEMFPPGMRGNLFSAEHNTRKIVRHRLTPKGSSYAAEHFDFVSTDDPDVHFSDVLEDRDGSLLALDTGSWYVQHCPTGRIRQAPARGGIYRVSCRLQSLNARAALTGAGSKDTQWAGAGRSQADHGPFLTAAAAIPDLRSALQGTDAVMVAAAARMLGRRAETNAAPKLTALLRSTNLTLRLAAAEALSHCGDPISVPALIEALSSDTDDFLEHALTFALHHLADKHALLAALDHRSVKVQRAALVLLDQPPFQPAPASAVARRLNASDARLEQAARWVLLRHPEWGEAGEAFINQLVERPTPTEADWEALAQFLPRFQTNATVISAIANSLLQANRPVAEAQRVRMLESLSLLDLPAAPPALTEAILRLLGTASSPIRLAAVHAAGALRLPDAERLLETIAHDSAQSASLRLEALRELVRCRPVVEGLEMDFLLGQLGRSNAPTARLAAAETLNSATLGSAQMTAFLKAVQGDALISPASIVDAVNRNPDIIRGDCAVALLEYLAGSLDAGWTISAEQLTKVQNAVPQYQRPRAGALLVRLEESIARQRRQLAEFEPLLKGGDYVRGQKVFHEKAQCMTCHQIWGNGGHVGPDLTSIGSIRAGRDILESLVLPSSTIAQGYETLIVWTKNGESYTGVGVGKSHDPLILRLASGAELTLHSSQIERIDHSKLSLMPEGLLNNLTRDDVRDLLGYLQQLK